MIKKSDQEEEEMYNILAKFDDFSRWFEIVAIDLNSAIADIEQAYGSFELISYNVK